MAAMQAPAGQQAQQRLHVRFEFGSTRVAMPPE
jgi:hypothetical protein